MDASLLYVHSLAIAATEDDSAAKMAALFMPWSTKADTKRRTDCAHEPAYELSDGGGRLLA